MPCIPVPKPPLPNIPAGLTLTAPLPQVPKLSNQAPCCLLPPLETPELPIPIPSATVNPAFVTAIREGLAAVEEYFDQIPLDCPRS